MNTNRPRLNSTSGGFQLKSLRQGNAQAIVQVFRQHETLTVRDISEHVQLSRTSINNIINTLVEKGIVQDCGKGSSTDIGGKKPDLYSLNPERSYCISLLFEATEIEAALLDLKLNTKHLIKHSFDKPLDSEGLANGLAEMLDNLMEMSQLQPSQIHSIVLHCAGVVDRKQETLVLPLNNSHWQPNMPVRQLFKERTQVDPSIHIYFDNTSRYAGYFELLKGNNRDEKSLLILSTYEENIGGSVIINGMFDRGSNGSVGEFGHTTICPSSKIQCRCGNWGCFESMVGTKRIRSLAKKALPTHADSLLADAVQEGTLSIPQLLQAADQKDTLARHLLDEIIGYFFLLIYNAQFTTDPEEVIIQNTYAAPSHYFRDQLQAKVEGQAFYNNMKITYSDFNAENCNSISFAQHLGAALYATDRYFLTPTTYK